MGKQACTVKLHLAEGHPKGLRFVEKANWTGIGIACPRRAYDKARTRAEFQRSGIYVLVEDPQEDSDLRRLYVGEADNLQRRIDQHLRDKDKDWDLLVLFTTRDNSHHKASNLYLQARLLKCAQNGCRAEIANIQYPTPADLGRDRHDLESFLEDLLLLLPLLGVDEFEAVDGDSPQASKAEADLPPQWSLVLGDVSATALLQGDGQMLVLKGSTARLEAADSFRGGYQKLRTRLLQEGVLRPTRSGQSLEFMANHLFRSPSAAAAIVYGHAANGRVAWHDKDGWTLNDHQATAIQVEERNPPLIPSSVAGEATEGQAHLFDSFR